jgi:hypothetical protein
MLSIGFESISRATLKSVHKHVNRPETFAALVEKVHSYGIMVFGLFMCGFDGDDRSVFDETVDFRNRRGTDQLPDRAASKSNRYRSSWPAERCSGRTRYAT